MPSTGEALDVESPYATHAHLQIKQRAAIEILRKDNAKLKEELLVENRHSVAPTSASASALLALLQDQSDVYTRKIGLTRSRLAEQQDRATVLRKKVEEQRKTMGGLTAATQQDIKANRMFKQQENRLQVAWQTHNEAQTATNALRGRIEGLRRERLACADILRKAERSLAARRSAMADLLTTSAAVAAECEQAMTETAALQAKTDRMQANSEEEWNQLTLVIQQDRQSREATRAAEIDERERRTQALVKAERGSKRRATVAGWGLARGMAAQNASTARMAQLTDAFSAVFSATGTENPTTLAEQLLAAEDSKYRLFSYVSELNAEIETLEDQIQGLRAELDHARTEAVAQEAARRTAEQEAEQRLVKAEEEAETLESRAGRALQRVTALRGAVGELFAAAGCESPSVRELLGPGGVTASNLMQYLGILEQAAHQLVQDCVTHDVVPAAAVAALALPRNAATKTATFGGLNGTGTGKSSQHMATSKGLQLVDLPSCLPSAADQGAAEEANWEVPLDGKALQAAAERSLQRRAEEGTIVRSKTTFGLTAQDRTHATLTK